MKNGSDIKTDANGTKFSQSACPLSEPLPDSTPPIPINSITPVVLRQRKSRLASTRTEQDEPHGATHASLRSAGQLEKDPATNSASVHVGRNLGGGQPREGHFDVCKTSDRRFDASDLCTEVTNYRTRKFGVEAGATSNDAN